MLPTLNDEDIDELEIQDPSDINRLRKAIRAISNVTLIISNETKSRIEKPFLPRSAIEIPHSNSYGGFKDIKSPSVFFPLMIFRNRNRTFSTEASFPTFQPHSNEIAEPHTVHSSSRSTVSIHQDGTYATIGDMISAYSRTMNSMTDDYNRTVSSQGGLFLISIFNRFESIFGGR